MGERIPDSFQRLLYRSQWDADAARDILQEFIADEFGDEDGIVITDETGFLKRQLARISHYNRRGFVYSHGTYSA